jgi:hypothetical protein
VQIKRVIRKSEGWNYRNSLLEPFILKECSICPLSCLDRCVAQQMLNICNPGTPTQQRIDKVFALFSRVRYFPTSTIDIGECYGSKKENSKEESVQEKGCCGQ